MGRAITVYSTGTITDDGLQAVMEHLKATRDFRGWELARGDRRIFIELASEDLAEMDDEDLRPSAELLRAWPKSSVVMIFDDSNPDNFEERMARAVAVALAERWKVVIDDHQDPPEIVYPPGQGPKAQDGP